MPLKNWISALRLRTLPLAAAGVVMGSFDAWVKGNFRPAVAILALCTAFLLQILSNLANDLGDFKKGTDNLKRLGPPRALQSGIVSEHGMKTAVIFTALLSLFSGVSLLYISFQGRSNVFLWLMLLAGLLAIGAALTYTLGKKPYGYAGFGDVAVFLFFGILAVAGTAFLHGKQFNPNVLWPAAGIGLLSAGVLNLNNLRDIDNDRDSGKLTLAVKLGFDKGKFYHIVLMDGAFLCFALYISALGGGRHWWSLLAFLPIYLITLRVFKTTQEEVVVYNVYLKQLALSTFLFTLLYVAFNVLVQ